MSSTILRENLRGNLKARFENVDSSVFLKNLSAGQYLLPDLTFNLSNMSSSVELLKLKNDRYNLKDVRRFDNLTTP